MIGIVRKVAGTRYQRHYDVMGWDMLDVMKGINVGDIARSAESRARSLGFQLCVSIARCFREVKISVVGEMVVREFVEKTDVVL
jgi:hypothetical protein